MSASIHIRCIIDCQHIQDTTVFGSVCLCVSLIVCMFLNHVCLFVCLYDICLGWYMFVCLFVCMCVCLIINIYGFLLINDILRELHLCSIHDGWHMSYKYFFRIGDPLLLSLCVCVLFCISGNFLWYFYRFFIPL